MKPAQDQEAWPRSVAEARVVQENLRGRVITERRRRRIRTVAGADVGFEQNGAVARAAVVVLDFPSLKLLEHVVVRRKTRFPYVPGYLSFREVPVVLAALARLKRKPDIILCDGQGYAHPRRFGLACHLGVVTNLPTIGVAKSRLIGTHEPVPPEKGAWVPLMDGDEQIGVVLRTRTGVAPLFVSVGHRIGLEQAIEIVLACTPKYRLPETTRQAHRLASG
jgi:deoxyribonuclease V